MTGWFIRYEAFPEWFAHSLDGYSGLMSGAPLVMDSWMRILFQDQPVGYSHSRVDSNGNSPLEKYIIENRTVLSLDIMGQKQNVNANARVALNSLYKLTQFYFIITSGRYSARIDGRLERGQTYRITIRTDAGTQVLFVEIPEDTLLYSPMTEMLIGRLKPGQELKVKALDPLTLQTTFVIVQAKAKEPITINGVAQDSTRLSMQLQGMETAAWVDGEGRMLRQETPFGWVMEATTPEQALKFDQAVVGNQDMLKTLAVPVQGRITDPENVKVLNLLFKGWPYSPDELKSARQEVVKVETNGLTLKVHAAKLPTNSLSINAMPPDVKPFLAASPFVQSAHPDILRRAGEIIGKERDSLKVALAIHHWVYRKVEKKITVSLPSALDVLKHMEGDCNEHTYLYVALARASGLPAKIVIGLVYKDGVFYYHAWPSVYVGEWLELDPTLGQTAVDATHLALLEGELSSQLRLLSLVGQLKTEVLSEEY